MEELITIAFGIMLFLIFFLFYLFATWPETERDHTQLDEWIAQGHRQQLEHERRQDLEEDDPDLENDEVWIAQ